jgi:hypothetical protein
LVVDSNPFLTNLDGLRHISSLGGNLIIWENTSLASLNGFLSHHITSLNGDLIIGENDSLTSLNGLENITRVGYRVDIFSNETLTSLSGLENLTSVDGGLDIKGNSSLTSLTGLENLIGVGGDLVILNNEALINLCALYNVNLGANSLSIGYNNALSMDTVFALRNQLIINGFTGLTATGGNNGSVQVFCDNDSDTVYDDTDNCPNVANPLQEDVDEDGVGNLCDANTVYGNISWAIQEGITLSIYILSCGALQPHATVITDSEGDYSFGNLGDGRYLLIASDVDYSFVPASRWIDIPQIEIKSYDFTTMYTCDSIDRFGDNGDGTVIDCLTGLLWLKNANCYGQQSWYNALSLTAGLNSGECGLSDGSVQGDWRLPTLEELQGIGTDPPTTWDGLRLVPWTMPSAPFVSVETSYGYWSSTAFASSTNIIWYLYMYSGRMEADIKSKSGYVWPVRSAN